MRPSSMSYCDNTVWYLPRDGLQKWLGTLSPCSVTYSYNILNSVLYTAITAPQAAFRNAAHCRTYSDFYRGLRVNKGIQILQVLLKHSLTELKTQPIKKKIKILEMGLAEVPERDSRDKSRGVHPGAKMLPVPPDTLSSSSILHTHL